MREVKLLDSISPGKNEIPPSPSFDGNDLMIFLPFNKSFLFSFESFLQTKVLGAPWLRAGASVTYRRADDAPVPMTFYPFFDR